MTMIRYDDVSGLTGEKAQRVRALIDRSGELWDMPDDLGKIRAWEEQIAACEEEGVPHLAASARFGQYSLLSMAGMAKESLAAFARLMQLTSRYGDHIHPANLRRFLGGAADLVVVAEEDPSLPRPQLERVVELVEQQTRVHGFDLASIMLARASLAAVFGEQERTLELLDAWQGIGSPDWPALDTSTITREIMLLEPFDPAAAAETLARRLATIGADLGRIDRDREDYDQIVLLQVFLGSLSARAGRKDVAARIGDELLTQFSVDELVRTATIRDLLVVLEHRPDDARIVADVGLGSSPLDPGPWRLHAALARSRALEDPTGEEAALLRELAAEGAAAHDARGGTDIHSRELQDFWFADLPPVSPDGRADGSDGRAGGSDGRAGGSDGRASGSDGRASGSDGRASGSDGRASGSADGRAAGSADAPGEDRAERILRAGWLARRTSPVGLDSIPAALQDDYLALYAQASAISECESEEEAEALVAATIARSRELKVPAAAFAARLMHTIFAYSTGDQAALALRYEEAQKVQPLAVGGTYPAFEKAAAGLFLPVVLTALEEPSVPLDRIDRIIAAETELRALTGKPTTPIAIARLARAVHLMDLGRLTEVEPLLQEVHARLDAEAGDVDRFDMLLDLAQILVPVDPGAVPGLVAEVLEKSHDPAQQQAALTWTVWISLRNGLPEGEGTTGQSSRVRDAEALVAQLEEDDHDLETVGNLPRSVLLEVASQVPGALDEVLDSALAEADAGEVAPLDTYAGAARVLLARAPSDERGLQLRESAQKIAEALDRRNGSTVQSERLRARYFPEG
ncbi:hypothetical protein ACXET9_07735 [Brachybacterium sp. DNPG3]